VWLYLDQLESNVFESFACAFGVAALRVEEGLKRRCGPLNCCQEGRGARGEGRGTRGEGRGTTDEGRRTRDMVPLYKKDADSIWPASRQTAFASSSLVPRPSSVPESSQR